MAASPVAILLQSLRECQLLEIDQLEAIAKHPLAQGDDAKALVRELVNRKWLTHYQVNLLAQGRGRELVVGQYRIVERLGEGNMGSVFKAVHHSMRRVVALKVIRKERLAHPDIVKRFHQEIKAAAQLVHPNIVLAFDAGQADGTHYYAMEYVEGSDLARRVQEQGPLPVLEACDYIRQAAQGLQHAHERGFVHRDIKPANLLVDRQTKTVKILDLGLARLQGAEGEHGLTRVGTTVGTPGYLAPEQALNARAVDIRADLYSLGCTFFYLLAGQAPFRGSNALEVIVKHRTEEAPGLFMYREDVPAAVQNIVRKLMAKKPEDRYQSPEELVQALAPFQPKSGEVLPAPVLRNRGKASTPIVSLPTAPARRRPWLAAAVAAGLFGALFLGTVLIVALFGFAPEEGPRDKGLTQAPPPGTSEPPKAEPPIRPEPEPKPKREPEPKTEPEPKPKTEPELKPEPPKPQPEPKSEPKPEPPKPEPKPEPPKPDPKPQPELPPRPEPKPEPKPQPSPLPGKLAVPAGPALTLAESQVRSRFKADYARKKPAELRAFAARLLDEAGKTMDPVERFVLLREARELAAQAGDLETAFCAAEETDRAYVVSLLELKIAVLERASRVPLQVSELQSLIDTATSIAEGLVDEDDYGPASRLLKSAEQAASSARLVPELVRIRNRIKEVALFAKEYEAVKPARAQLKSDPNDPEANYQWGRFLCLIKGHWAQGLPYLAAGSNVPLRDQAKKDLARPNDVEDRLEVANGWFALGSAEREAAPTSPAAVQLLQRARVWYELTVRKGETPPLTEQRLKEIARLLVREEPPPVKPPVSTPMDNRTRWNALILAARNAFREGNYAEALKRYNEALEIYPKDGTALQGIKHVQQAQYQQAMAAGQKALLAGRYGEAIKEFKLALEASPDDELARNLLRRAEAAHFSLKNAQP